MIPIKRPPAPAFLLDAEGRWQKETGAAIAHYLAGNTKSFKFEMYNDSALKDELKKVFKKCAYCETSYGAVYDGDVEHFRPKGKVNEKNPQTPGYYWLANDWDNLLLSCQHCNQRRLHQLEGDERLQAYGKLDQFPLSDETRRINDHQAQIVVEDSFRLLLNPCIDNPEQHLEYESTEGVISSTTPQGITSIKVYALQRPLLVQERKKQLILLFAQMRRVKRELERLNTDNSQAQKESFELELDDLLSFTQTESLYAGMCRFFVRRFLKENNITI